MEYYAAIKKCQGSLFTLKQKEFQDMLCLEQHAVSRTTCVVWLHFCENKKLYTCIGIQMHRKPWMDTVLRAIPKRDMNWERRAGM